MVVDGSSASTTYTASPNAASAAPIHTDQPRHRTERAECVGEQRGADHGQHEPAGVDDPSERQRRHHAERGQRERRHETRRAGPSRAHRATSAAVRVSVSFHAVANGVVDASTTTTDACGATAAGWVSTTTTPMPAERAERAQGVGRDPAEHRDRRGRRGGARAGCSSTDGQAVAVVGTDGGEHVDHVVARDRRRCRAPRRRS